MVWDWYVAGWRAAGRCVGLIVLLYAVSVVIAVICGAAAWVGLAQMLDASLATRTLATTLDANVFIDLLAHHWDSLAALGVTAVVVGGGAIVLWIWMNAALVVAVAGPHGVRASLRRGWGLFPVFAGLWGLTVVVAAALLELDWLAVRLITDWAAERGSGPPPLMVAAGGIIVAALVLLVLVAAHDHARIRAVATAGGAVRAWAWAWRFVWVRRGDVLAMLGLLALTAAVLWALDGALGWTIAPTTPVRLTLSVLVAQLAALGRVAVRACWFAAETALQRGATRAAE